MRAVVCTVVHHPADARIFYREIQALLDAGHDVTYIAPHGESAASVRDENQGQSQDQANSERGRGDLRLVTIPRASGRRRAGPLPAARSRPRGPRPASALGGFPRDRGRVGGVELGRRLTPPGSAVELVGGAAARAGAHTEAGGAGGGGHGSVPTPDALRLVEGSVAG